MARKKAGKGARKREAAPEAEEEQLALSAIYEGYYTQVTPRCTRWTPERSSSTNREQGEQQQPCSIDSSAGRELGRSDVCTRCSWHGVAQEDGA